MSEAISIALGGGGLILPLSISMNGRRRIPLKPICEFIGVNWVDQRQKIADGYLSRRLGVAIDSVFWRGQRREMVLIDVDQIPSFIFSINPMRVRAGGNISSADWLEKKHIELDDVLNRYEVAKGEMFYFGSTKKLSVGGV